MFDTDENARPPAELGPALDMVRALWREGDDRDLPERIVAWAMMIEAVDRLTRLHGPSAMAVMLDRLREAVGDIPAAGGRTLQ